MDRSAASPNAVYTCQAHARSFLAGMPLQVTPALTAAR